MITNLAMVLAAVIMVESSGNLEAVNEAEQAYGATQIRQLALDDLNQYYGTSYLLQDFLGNEQLARWAFIHYPRLYGAKTPEECCRAWNSGSKWREKYHLTDGYWQKVRNKAKMLNGRGL